MDHKRPLSFACGIIEGFYGRPWTPDQRHNLFKILSNLGLNIYMYAPKDDSKHRAYWRELYNKEEADLLISLIRTADECNIEFVYAISPGLDMCYSDAGDMQRLHEKLEQVRSFGCRAFAILFDDIEVQMSAKDQEHFASFAAAQVHVTNEVYESLHRPDLFFFCPTEYCASRSVPSVLDSNYLLTVGSQLKPGIDVLWTGPRVISKHISLESVRAIAKVLCRKPLIWDNIHANDYDQKRLFLGPYKGRMAELRPYLRGVLSNPNCEFETNFLALHTLAQWAGLLRSAPSDAPLPLAAPDADRDQLNDADRDQLNDADDTDNTLLDANGVAMDTVCFDKDSPLSNVVTFDYSASDALIYAIRDWMPAFYLEKNPYIHYNVAKSTSLTGQLTVQTCVGLSVPAGSISLCCVDVVAPISSATTTVSVLRGASPAALPAATVGAAPHLPDDGATAAIDLFAVAPLLLDGIVLETVAVSKEDAQTQAFNSLAPPQPPLQVSPSRLIDYDLEPMDTLPAQIVEERNQLQSCLPTPLTDVQLEKLQQDLIVKALDYSAGELICHSAPRAPALVDQMQTEPDAAEAPTLQPRAPPDGGVDDARMQTRESSPRPDAPASAPKPDPAGLMLTRSGSIATMDCTCATDEAAGAASADVSDDRLDAATAASAHAAGLSNRLSLDDLQLLVELFYLPFEHGSEARRLLDEIVWLKQNVAAVCFCCLKRSGSATLAGGERAPRPPAAKVGDVAMAPDAADAPPQPAALPPPPPPEGLLPHAETPAAAVPPNTPALPPPLMPPTHSLSAPNADSASGRIHMTDSNRLVTESEWRRRAHQLQLYIERIRRLQQKLCEIPNRSLLFDLYPYVHDICGIFDLLSAFVKWLDLGHLMLDSGDYMNNPFSWGDRAYRDSFGSGDYDPWVFRGGLAGELQRLLPLETGVDLFYQIPPSYPYGQLFTIRPFLPDDKAQVYQLYRDSSPLVDAANQDAALTKLLGDCRIGCFLERSIQYCFVVEDCRTGELSGYALGCLYTKQFRQNFLTDFVPQLRRKYPRPATTSLVPRSPSGTNQRCTCGVCESDDAGCLSAPLSFDDLLRILHCDELLQQHSFAPICSDELYRTYPSLLVLGIPPRHAIDDHSVPKRTLACLLSSLKANGSYGAHCQLVAAGPGDVLDNAALQHLELYEKLGFARVDQAGAPLAPRGAAASTLAALPPDSRSCSVLLMARRIQ